MIRGTAGDRALSGQWTAVGGPECAGGGLSCVCEVVCPRHRQSGVSPVPHTPQIVLNEMVLVLVLVLVLEHARGEIGSFF